MEGFYSPFFDTSREQLDVALPEVTDQFTARKTSDRNDLSVSLHWFFRQF